MGEEEENEMNLVTVSVDGKTSEVDNIEEAIRIWEEHMSEN